MPKKIPEDRLQHMKSVAMSRGGQLLSNDWQGGNTKYEWLCREGHTWSSTWYSISSGTWCGICSGAKVDTSKRLEDMRSLAVSRNGQLISPIWINSDTKYEWCCDAGHIWKATWHSISHSGSWCPTCSGNTKRTLEELKELVESRGGKLLTTTYTNVDDTYEFECNLGHNFSNRYLKVLKYGQWCPVCSKGRKSEEIARTTLEQLFKSPFPKKRPGWLRNDRGRQMELDGFSEDLGLAFEYQGAQHFNSVAIFAGDLAVRIKDDRLKVKLCREHGVELFVLTYEMAHDEFPQHIYEQAVQKGLKLKPDFLKIKIDYSKAYIKDDRLEDLVDLLKPKQIEVLSTKWLTTNDHYEFKCLICGHLWKAKGSSFFNRRRVSGCDACSRRVAAEARSGSIEEIEQFANKFQGHVLSREYCGQLSNYEFECVNQHRFTRNFRSMLDSNSFCHKCEGKGVRSHRAYHVRLSEQQAIEVFRSFGLEPLEPYRSTVSRWKSRCLKCGEEVAPALERLETGAHPCVYCSGLKTRTSEALAFFNSKGLIPVDPNGFTNVSKGWDSICSVCGEKVSPSLSSLRRGQGSCRFCANVKRRKKY